MKKGVLITLLVIIITGAAGAFISFDVTRVQTIKASMFDLSAQISNLQNWKKWDARFINPADSISGIVTIDKKQTQIATANGKITAILTVINPALVQLQQTKSGSVQIIALQPTEKQDVTAVSWSSKINGFRWLAATIFGSDEITGQLNLLKKFAESTEGIYGYPIAIRKVTELIICTKTETIAPGNLQPFVITLLADIRQFLKTNNLPAAKNYYYVSTSSVIGGKLELTVGIPVASEILASNNFKFLKFPVGGNLLTGTYKGTLSGIPQIYAAMDKYVRDKRLSKVAQSMEKYTDDPSVLAAHSNDVVMQLIYPVY